MAIDVAKTLAKMVATRKALLAMPHAYGGADVKGEIDEAIAEQFQAEVRALVSMAMGDAYTEEAVHEAEED